MLIASGNEDTERELLSSKHSKKKKKKGSQKEKGADITPKSKTSTKDLATPAAAGDLAKKDSVKPTLEIPKAAAKEAAKPVKASTKK
jgi:hypothetical protein